MKGQWQAAEPVTTNPRGKKNEFLELLRFAFITLLIVIPIRVFIAQPFIVNGESMVPTFDNGDYLIIDQVTYKTGTPERGDVVVFRYPTDGKRFLIKRVIGLPGETVTLSGDKVAITESNGSELTLDEGYTNGDFSSYGQWELRDEEYFVMGDNRNASSDSRSWGVLREDKIIGKTFLRLFPLSGLSVTPGEYQPEEFEIAVQVTNEA